MATAVDPNSVGDSDLMTAHAVRGRWAGAATHEQVVGDEERYLNCVAVPHLGADRVVADQREVDIPAPCQPNTVTERIRRCPTAKLEAGEEIADGLGSTGHVAEMLPANESHRLSPQRVRLVAAAELTPRRPRATPSTKARRAAPTRTAAPAACNCSTPDRSTMTEARRSSASYKASRNS